jgi:PAS domain-containing protein
MGLAALKNGAQDYLVKGDLESASLSRAIRYALERNRLEQRFSKLFNYSSDAILMFRPVARELQRRTKQLEDSEARFRSTFDNAAIGMALVSSDGRFLSVNKAACNLWGYPKEELLHKTFKNSHTQMI